MGLGVSAGSLANGMDVYNMQGLGTNFDRQSGDWFEMSSATGEITYGTLRYVIAYGICRSQRLFRFQLWSLL